MLRPLDALDRRTMSDGDGPGSNNLRRVAAATAVAIGTVAMAALVYRVTSHNRRVRRKRGSVPI